MMSVHRWPGASLALQLKSMISQSLSYSQTRNITSIKLISKEVLHDSITAIIHAAGSHEKESQLVAGHIVEAHLKGHDSHGVTYLPEYMEGVKSRNLIPNQTPHVVIDAPSYSVLDGRRGYGQVMGYEAMKIGITKAKKTGIALIALRNSHHLGRIGHWAEQCAQEGLISLHFVNVFGHDPIVATYNGKRPRLGTNPITIAIPREPGHPPVLLDMATSKLAQGKLLAAMNRGLSLSPGIVIDHEGEPSTDPAVRFREPKGAILPFGDYKGSGLLVIAEILAGIFAGQGLSRPDRYEQLDAVCNNMLSILFDPKILLDTATDENFSASSALSSLESYLKDASRDPEAAPVLLPGDKETESYLQRSKEGIPIDSTTWEKVTEAGVSMGLQRRALSNVFENGGKGLSCVSFDDIIRTAKKFIVPFLVSWQKEIEHHIININPKSRR